MRHLDLMASQECDVWLLTEVSQEIWMPGMTSQHTAGAMSEGRSWACILSHEALSPLPDPHHATVMASGCGVRFISSVLPWRSCGSSWEGPDLAGRLSHVLSRLREHMEGDTVWGGDWNQALQGLDYVGTTRGRSKILELLEAAGMSVPTLVLGSASVGHGAIDHIAVPRHWDVTEARQVSAVHEGRRLSDHDVYVVAGGSSLP